MALLYCCEKVAYSIRLAQRSVLTVTLDVAQFYVYRPRRVFFLLMQKTNEGG